MEPNAFDARMKTRIGSRALCSVGLVTLAYCAEKGFAFSHSANPSIIPVGLFCPFRSEKMLEMEKKKNNLVYLSPAYSEEIDRLERDLQLGGATATQRLITTAAMMDNCATDWQSFLDELEAAEDFQTREMRAFNQQVNKVMGEDGADTVELLRWQGAVCRSIAVGTQPPEAPPGVDVNDLVDKAQKGPVGYRADKRAVSAKPFNVNSMGAGPVVLAEYIKLVSEHKSLIERGSTYGSFSPEMQISYLDAIAEIQDRWDIFFKRSSLMGSLDPSFVEQANDLLEQYNLDQIFYRTLLDEAHQEMRKEAERKKG